MAQTIDEEYTPIWKDRKRFLGMPITFTKYSVTKDRFILQQGFFRTETDELLLYRILDIKLVRGLWQKIFGVGTITLFSADKSHGAVEIKNVKNSDGVRKFLSKIVEQERTAKGLTGRELYGAAASPNDADFADLDGDGVPD